MLVWIFLNTQILRPYSDLTRKLGLWSATALVVHKGAAERFLRKVVHTYRTLKALCVNYNLGPSYFYFLLNNPAGTIGTHFFQTVYGERPLDVIYYQNIDANEKSGHTTL